MPDCSIASVFGDRNVVLDKNCSFANELIEIVKKENLDKENKAKSPISFIDLDFNFILCPKHIIFKLITQRVIQRINTILKTFVNNKISN